MASLQELLVEEGFVRYNKANGRHQKKVKFRDRRAHDESIVLPIYVCHERRKSSDSKHNKANSQSGSILSSSTRRGASDSGRSVTRSKGGGNEPAIDDVSVRAVVSILGGYVGQYLRDKKFREAMRAKCLACLTREKDLEDAQVHNMELGIANVERLVEDHQEHGEKLNTKSLQYCIWVFSTTTTAMENGSKCATERSLLAACAYLYLSVVYKIYKSDQTSARHLLQVFCESPFLARTHLLPDVWEHLFLPHLLHIKIWYTEEAESLSNSAYPDFNDMKMEALVKAYNDQMDVGTRKFALYYKEWLKDGAKAPAIPSVPLPSALNLANSRRRYSESFTAHSSSKSSLYQAIFGPILERRSTEANDKIGVNPQMMRSLGRETSKSISRRNGQGDICKDHKKSNYIRRLRCRGDASEGVVRRENSLGVSSVLKERIHAPNEVSGAITTICTSDSLTECETAIRLISKALLKSDSDGDSIIATAASNAQVTEAILEVLSASSDDEVLELAISILAQLMTKEESNANIILNFDQQLDIFLTLLRNNSLFLKAAVLLYLAKPKAKQMISMEWIPLVLRVLEFGDQLQALFTIQCRPQEAAYYFLHQLLNCFDEDKNMENAGYVVSLGGLNLLLTRMEIGDTCEMNKAASIIYCCILADGSCRHYLADKMKKECLVSLLVQRDSKSPQCQGFALLSELFCLNMHNQRTVFLNQLMKGWEGMNTMHILLVYLQRAQPQERPMVAALLLQLDVLGDRDLLGRECSVYREEAVDEIVKALDCGVLDERVQEKCAKALLILGGHFTYTGEAVTEGWLLKQAGFESHSLDSFSRNMVEFNEHPYLAGDEKAAEKWQRRMALALLQNGRGSLLEALSGSLGNGIPCLARASLATVCWISSFLQPFEDRSFQTLACCTLVPQLLASLNYDKAIEERVLASFSLLSLLEGSDYQLRSRALINEELMEELEKLSQVTWTAKRLISVISSNLFHLSSIVLE